MFFETRLDHHDKNANTGPTHSAIILRCDIVALKLPPNDDLGGVWAFDRAIKLGLSVEHRRLEFLPRG